MLTRLEIRNYTLIDHLELDIGPYTLQLAWTRPGGVTLVQDGPASPALVLAAGERVSLAGVNVVVRPKDGP